MGRISVKITKSSLRPRVSEGNSDRVGVKTWTDDNFCLYKNKNSFLLILLLTGPLLQGGPGPDINCVGGRDFGQEGP